MLRPHHRKEVPHHVAVQWLLISCGNKPPPQTAFLLAAKKSGSLGRAVGLALLTHEITHVATLYGTEGFTQELAEALRGVQRVKLAYDSDEAGERAATRDSERLRALGVEVYRIKFPWGMDANEYARKVTPPGKSLSLLINAAQWMGKGKEPPVIPSAMLVPYAEPPVALAASPSSDSRMMSSWMKEAGLQGLGSCHVLRHTCATHMLEGGADIRYIQQLLGHANLDTTSIYTQVSIRQLQEVHARCHPSGRLARAEANG